MDENSLSVHEQLTLLLAQVQSLKNENEEKQKIIEGFQKERNSDKNKKNETEHRTRNRSHSTGKNREASTESSSSNIEIKHLNSKIKKLKSEVHSLKEKIHQLQQDNMFLRDGQKGDLARSVTKELSVKLPKAISTSEIVATPQPPRAVIPKSDSNEYAPKLSVRRKSPSPLRTQGESILSKVIEKAKEVNLPPHRTTTSVMYTHARRMSVSIPRIEPAVSNIPVLRRQSSKYYADLLRFDQKSLKAICKVQATVKGKRTRKSIAKFPQRSNVANEIFETEESYVQKMELVIELYYPSMLSLLGDPAIEIIFGRTFLQIVETNKMFISKLKECCKHFTFYSQIGPIFLWLIPHLSPMIDFVVNFEISNHYLSKAVSKNEDLKKLLRAISKSPECSNLDFNDLYIMPVQRMMRYSLLLGDLLKYTPVLYPDHSLVETALNQVKRLNAFINERSGWKKNMFAVKKSISGFLSNIVSRERFCAGVFTSVRVNGSKKPHNVFLFNNMLVWGTQQHNNTKYVKHIMFSSAIRLIPENYVAPLSIQIVKPNSSPVTLLFASQHDYTQFSNAITQIVYLSEHELTPIYPPWLKYIDGDLDKMNLILLK